MCAMSFVLCGTGEGIAQQAFENHGADYDVSTCALSPTQPSCYDLTLIPL